jgi:formate-dependent nitrite reductase membrane component NrfD
MDLKAQSHWRWGVAAYLFLVGLGAGAYVVGVLADFRGPEWRAVAETGVFLGFPCCALAGLVKLSQLGKPAVAWRAWMKPGTSWIARGSLLLCSFMAVSFLHLVLWIWPTPFALGAADGARYAVGVLGAVLGTCLMLYTGILLTAARPIAFWSTAILPLLFLLSALLSGMLAIVLLCVLRGTPFEGPIAALEQLVVAFLILEGIAIGTYLQSTHQVTVARASVSMLLTGSLAPLFWLGVALVGVVAPLALSALAIAAFSPTLAAAGALCGLLGGLFLRQVVLAGGIHAPLRAGSFEVPLPIV